MRTLIKFLLRFKTLFFFLALEILSLVLIVNHNQFQRVHFLHTSNSLVGSVFRLSNSVSDYFKLSDVNESLALENSLLKERLFYLEGQLSSFKYMPTFELDSSKYKLITAKVIQATTNYRNNYLTLDKGSADGLKVGMGVVSDLGVVGIVCSVSTHFSAVLPIINDNSRISVQVEGKTHSGTLKWQKADIRYAFLDEVPLYVSIAKGDGVKTSGYSTVFPEGINVGVVEEVRKKNDNFYDIKVNLAVDYNNLHFVNVISFIHSEENDSLQMKGGSLDD